MNNPTIREIKPLLVPDNYQKDSNGNINPFHLDFYHMGQTFSKSVMLMFKNHTHEPAEYLILVNMKTGERMRIDFPENWQ